MTVSSPYFDKQAIALVKASGSVRQETSSQVVGNERFRALSSNTACILLF